MTIRTTRRGFLGAASLASLAAPALAANYSSGAFTHGVASGDPDVNSVVLWTRFRPGNGGNARIGWEVAESETFATPSAKGELLISAADDHCVKVIARGLKPGRRYAYRFLSASGASPTGFTRTAPQGKTSALTFAAFSCANKPQGYFHAYADAAARDDIELCIHLGDYIYEMERGNYPSLAEAVPGRTIVPDTELRAYRDYCARYASYRDDADLQELHRVKPWAVIWDDHEFANDTWMNGAGAQDDATDGPWAARKAAAVKAYCDWMPIRHTANDGLRIYRRLDWGDLASILLLDTRLIGRDAQGSARTALAGAAQQGPDALKKAAQAFAANTLNDPRHSMLGAAQEVWLAQQLRASKASGRPWQVLAQQVVVGEQIIAASAPKMLPPDASDWQRSFVQNAVTFAELGLPWNMDSWAGYPAARTRFLESCARDANNALVLSGDSHSAWAYDLPGANAAPAAVEIGVTSVASTGFERTFSNAAPGEREAAMLEANKELAWCDITNRGYTITQLTPQNVEATYVQLSDVTTSARPNATSKTIAAEARKGAGVGPWQV